MTKKITGSVDLNVSKQSLKGISDELAKSLSKTISSELKKAFKDSAKVLSTELKKELKGIKVGSGGAGGLSGQAAPNIGGSSVTNREFNANMREQKLHNAKALQIQTKAAAADISFKKQAHKQAMLSAKAGRAMTSSAGGALVSQGGVSQGGALVPSNNGVVRSAFGGGSGGDPNTFDAEYTNLGSSSAGGRGRRSRVTGISRMGMTKGLASIGAGITGATMLQNRVRMNAAELRNREAMDTLGGNYLGGRLRQEGRDEISANSVGGAVGGAGIGAGVGAGIGLAIGGVATALTGGTAAPAIPMLMKAGGWIGGLTGGYLGNQEGKMRQGELNVKDQEAAISMSKSARQLTRPRLDAMAGTDLRSADITGLQDIGTKRGYSPSETLQQFGTAKSYLGGQGAADSLGFLQDQKRGLGISVAQSASAMETFQGLGQAKGNGQKALKDAISQGFQAGVDKSKLGQFVQATSSFIQQNAGLGQINSYQAGGRLSDLTAGYAGGGKATAQNIAQAQQSATMDLQNSRSMGGGLATYGNYLAAQKALKGTDASAGDLLGLMNAKSTDEKAMGGILGKLGVGGRLDELVKGKTDTIRSAEKSLGDTGVIRYAGDVEQGLSTGEGANKRRAGEWRANFNGPMPDGSAAAGDIGKTEDAKFVMAEARLEQKKFVEGFKSLGVVTNIVNENFALLGEASNRLMVKFMQMSGQDGPWKN